MAKPDSKEPLVEGEVVVDDENEMLYRQVHPNYFDGGVLSSQVFLANSGDEGMVSVARSSIVTAEKAFDDYLAAGRASVGCVQLLVSESHAQGAPVIDDSKVPGRSTPDGHSYLDFRPDGPTRGQARQLRNAAESREWGHGPIEKP